MPVKFVEHSEMNAKYMKCMQSNANTQKITYENKINLKYTQINDFHKRFNAFYPDGYNYNVINVTENNGIIIGTFESIDKKNKKTLKFSAIDFKIYNSEEFSSAYITSDVYDGKIKLKKLLTSINKLSDSDVLGMNDTNNIYYPMNKLELIVVNTKFSPTPIVIVYPKGYDTSYVSLEGRSENTITARHQVLGDIYFDTRIFRAERIPSLRGNRYFSNNLVILKDISSNDINKRLAGISIYGHSGDNRPISKQIEQAKNDYKYAIAVKINNEIYNTYEYGPQLFMITKMSKDEFENYKKTLSPINEQDKIEINGENFDVLYPGKAEPEVLEVIFSQGGIFAYDNWPIAVFNTDDNKKIFIRFDPSAYEVVSDDTTNYLTKIGPKRRNKSNRMFR